jgi:hypothetical protein
VWRVTLHGDIVLDGSFHAWLPLTGFIPPDVRFLSPDPDYTVTVPGTATGPITCGAYNSLTGAPYPPSSRGPTRRPELSPDLAAPGVNVSGVFPYGEGLLSGTGVAAAITAGAAALLLQWGVVERNDPIFNTFRIKAFLIRGCTRAPGVAYPNNIEGYGRLNLLNTFNQMRNIY